MCESDFDCAALFFCNPTRFRCEPIPGTVPRGSPCSNDLQCRASLLCQSGTCAPVTMPGDIPGPHHLAALEYVILIGIIIAVIAMLIPLALVCLPSHWTARVRYWFGMKDRRSESTQQSHHETMPSAYVYDMAPYQTTSPIPTSHGGIASGIRVPPNSPASQPEYDARMGDDEEPLPAYEQAPPKYDDVVPHDATTTTTSDNSSSNIHNDSAQ